LYKKTLSIKMERVRYAPQIRTAPKM